MKNLFNGMMWFVLIILILILYSLGLKARSGGDMKGLDEQIKHEQMIW